MNAVMDHLNAAQWYCVRSKTRKERMAAGNLASQYGLEVFCPQIRFQRKTVRGTVWFQEAMFPGYFFVRCDLQEMKRAVTYAPGVLNLPVFDGRNVAVPEDIIQALREELDEDQLTAEVEPLAVGEETTILEGSMSGIKVKVVKLMPAQERVGVLMELMGTLVEAEFPNDALEHRPKHPLAMSA